MKKLTSYKWCSFFKIKITVPDGFDNPQFFMTEKITKRDFLERCSKSVIEPPKYLNKKEGKFYMGKGSKPRNCFSKQFKDNYDKINWGAKKEIKKTVDQGELFKLLEKNPELEYKLLPFNGDTWWYEIQNNY